MAPRGRTEFVDEFALRLPLAVIGDLLGIPEADHEEILAGTQVIRTVGTGGRSPPGDRAAVGQAQERLHAHFTGPVAAHRAPPREGLVSGPFAAPGGGGPVSGAGLGSPRLP